MHPSTRSRLGAIRDLERSLIRRRLLGLDPRLRVELTVLTLLVGGFLFWRVRVPLDGLVRARGQGAGLSVLAVAWLTLGAVATGLAGMRHARILRARAAVGPEWLALPLEPGTLARHLAWESRGPTIWLAVPAVAALVAAAGLLPWFWLAVLAGAFALLLPAAGALGCALAYHVALRTAALGHGPRSIESLLSQAMTRSKPPRRAPAAWRRGPAWRILAAKDLRLTMRHGPLRRAAAWPLVLWLASLFAWRLPIAIGMQHVVAFALALFAAAGLAEWLILLTGSDPFPALRVLPIGVSTVWRARMATAVMGAVAVVAGQGWTAGALSPHARALLMLWSGGATLAITVLGVNYGLTLFPRADVAGRMLGLSLALAMAASVMIPLTGWILLLAAVLHSLPRLRRWSRLEEA